MPLLQPVFVDAADEPAGTATHLAAKLALITAQTASRCRQQPRFHQRRADHRLAAGQPAGLFERPDAVAEDTARHRTRRAAAARPGAPRGRLRPASCRIIRSTSLIGGHVAAAVAAVGHQGDLRTTAPAAPPRRDRRAPRGSGPAGPRPAGRSARRTTRSPNRRPGDAGAIPAPAASRSLAANTLERREHMRQGIGARVQGQWIRGQGSGDRVQSCCPLSIIRWPLTTGHCPLFPGP